MDGKHEEFWRQGDFGYVKKEVDSMMTLCKPQAKVSPSVKLTVSTVCVVKPNPSKMQSHLG